jgi:glucose-6-phosphate isomerase
MTHSDLIRRGEASVIAPLACLLGDPARHTRLNIEAKGLHFDFSRAKLSQADLDALLSHAQAIGLEQARTDHFAGKAINSTEDRAVMHMALRQTERDFYAKGEAISDAVRSGRTAATRFALGVRAGTITAKDGRPFKAIVHLGIGGSDLGPRLVYEALAPTQGTDIKLRFAANIEPGELAAALVGLDPRETLILCVSKTFTTIETLENLKAARAWLQAGIGPDDSAHLVAISAAPAKTAQAGFAPDRVFDFKEWVGGRFSLWSAVGLSCEIALGPDVIEQMHAGAASMDTLFETAEFAQNPVILAGLIGWWNRTCLGYKSRAVIPYAKRLRLLPQFLQQLEMESNGKSVGLDGQAVATSGPVVWGAEGTNAQHAFFQHLHQSPDVTPVEFIALAKDQESAPERTRMTLANALAQAEALTHGKCLADVTASMRQAGASSGAIEALAPHRVFSGNRPSSFVLMDQLSAFNFGSYLAFCEHRTFVEGKLWGVNSFDQWGVELGKVIASEIDQDLRMGASPQRDPSSVAMIERIRTLRGLDG